MKFFGLFDTIGTSSDRKTAQKIFVALSCLALFIIVTFFVLSTNENPRRADAGTFNIVKEDKTLKAKWVGETAGEIKQQKDGLNSMQKALKDLQEDNKKMAEELKKIKEDKTRALPAETQSNDGPLDKNGLFKNFPKPDVSTSEKLDKYVPKGIKDLDALIASKGDTRSDKEAKADLILNKTPIVEKHPYQNSLNVVTVPQKNNDSNNSKSKEPLDLLPSASIIKARLVNGMDAPTMSQAKDNPLITLLLVTDLAILPNKYKYDIRECHVLGEGYGDLASERVYIRANNLSCITEDGEHIDYELKGYVAGEDGKIGLRGVVVSKQGAMLARAIMAGFVDGVGKAFSQVGNTVQVTPYGTTTSNSDISTSELTKKGIYSGLSTGASKLADFYLKLADQVYPVIEIEANREVDIVVSTKREMKTLEETSQATQTNNQNTKDKDKK